MTAYHFVAEHGGAETKHRSVSLKPQATFAERLIASITPSPASAFTLCQDGMSDEDGIGGVSYASVDAGSFFPGSSLPTPPPMSWLARYHDLQGFDTRDEAVRQLAHWIVADAEEHGP